MYTSLISRYPNRVTREPDWNKMISSSSRDLEIALRNGPYFRTKARHIINVISTVRSRFQKDSNDWVGAFDTWCENNDTNVVREYLLSLSGIGKKTAACVMLYRLRRVDFAIDTNIMRIGTRLGWFTEMNIRPKDSFPKNTKGKTFAKRQAEGLKKFANRAHTYVLKNLTETASQPQDVEMLFQAHFALMLHGETVCWTKKPKCVDCPLVSICHAKKNLIRTNTVPTTTVK